MVKIGVFTSHIWPLYHLKAGTDMAFHVIVVKLVMLK